MVRHSTDYASGFAPVVMSGAMIRVRGDVCHLDQQNATICCALVHCLADSVEIPGIQQLCGTLRVNLEDAAYAKRAPTSQSRELRKVQVSVQSANGCPHYCYYQRRLCGTKAQTDCSGEPRKTLVDCSQVFASPFAHADGLDRELRRGCLSVHGIAVF